MSVSNEAQVKQSVQNAIKTVLIDSKYHDEPITFGQAIVTHHFLQQMMQGNKSHTQSQEQSYPVTHAQHLQNLTRSTSAQNPNASQTLDSHQTSLQ